MDDKYLLKKFIEHGDIMRYFQKSFFKEKDPAKRKELLQSSKKAELEFDNLLFNAKQLIK